MNLHAVHWTTMIFVVRAMWDGKPPYPLPSVQEFCHRALTEYSLLKIGDDATTWRLRRIEELQRDPYLLEEFTKEFIRQRLKGNII